MANQVDYRDPTPNNFPQDYDPSKVDSRVKLRSESIKHKQKGKHTREAMYQAFEIGSVTANEAKETAIDTASRQDAFENRYNEQIAGNTNLDEVIDARDGENTLRVKELKQDARLNVVEDNTIGTLIFSDDLLPGGAYRAIFDAQVARIRANFDSKKFNVIALTDLHYEQNNPEHGYGYSGFGLNHIPQLSS